MILEPDVSTGAIFHRIPPMHLFSSTHLSFVLVCCVSLGNGPQMGSLKLSFGVRTHVGDLACSIQSDLMRLFSVQEFAVERGHKIRPFIEFLFLCLIVTFVICHYPITEPDITDSILNLRIHCTGSCTGIKWGETKTAQYETTQRLSISGQIPVLRTRNLVQITSGLDSEMRVKNSQQAPRFRPSQSLPPLFS